MIQTLSWLNVADNSGARNCVYCFLGSKEGSIGDIIIAVVRTSNIPTKKSDVVRAVIVRTTKGIKRENGIIRI
jgi:large subunit ribosomal protein L14